MKKPRIEVICVGTELLTGKVNTHTAAIGLKLLDLGLEIAREHAVSDDPNLMREVFSDAFRRADAVLCCGGLGPTFDDITRDVWSRIVKRPLVFRPELLTDIKEKFKKRGLTMAPHNRRQAHVIRGASVLYNPFGTAPGLLWESKTKSLVLLPGPARELHPMLDTYVLPHLRKRFPGLISRRKTFLLTGVPESEVDEWVRPWVAKNARLHGCHITHGILASNAVISVKFTVSGQNAANVDLAATELEASLRKILGKRSFGEDNDTLESIIGDLLRQKSKTLAVAESCTGGLISKILTDQPGSSDYFVEGITTYHNRSKVDRLGVKKSTLEKYGAVSKQTAREMAQGLRRRAGVDYALSVTGIAGPGGGTKEKPVGLVYIGLAGPRGTTIKEFRFNGERAWVRNRSALMALDTLRRALV